MAKKGSKSKGKKDVGPEIITTQTIIQEREKMLCPRMGDIYVSYYYNASTSLILIINLFIFLLIQSRTQKVEFILEVLFIYKLHFLY